MQCGLVWLLLTMSLNPQSGAENTEDQFLEFLTLELEQARARIRSVTYEYEFETTRFVSVKGPVQGKGGGVVRENRTSRFNRFRRSTTIAGQEQGPELIAVAVANEEYFATKPYQHNILVKYKRTESELSLESFDLLRQTVWGIDFMSYGFGSGDETLRDARANPDRSYRWEVLEKINKSGRAVFVVQRFTPIVVNQEIPTTEFIIDPEKGFLITKVIARVMDGSIGLERKILVEEIGPEKIWFPVKVEETVYASWVQGPGRGAKLKGTFSKGPNGRLIARSKVFRITKVQINEPIPDEAFTLEALGLKDGSTFAYVNETGESQMFVYVDGVEILKDDYLKLSAMSSYPLERSPDSLESLRAPVTAGSKSNLVLPQQRESTQAEPATTDSAEKTTTSNESDRLLVQAIPEDVASSENAEAMPETETADELRKHGELEGSEIGPTVTRTPLMIIVGIVLLAIGSVAICWPRRMYRSSQVARQGS